MYTNPLAAASSISLWSVPANVLRLRPLGFRVRDRLRTVCTSPVASSMTTPAPSSSINTSISSSSPFCVDGGLHLTLNLFPFTRNWIIDFLAMDMRSKRFPVTSTRTISAGNLERGGDRLVNLVECCKYGHLLLGQYLALLLRGRQSVIEWGTGLLVGQWQLLSAVAVTDDSHNVCLIVGGRRQWWWRCNWQ